MANSIGSVNFDLTDGPPVPAMQAELRLTTREGIDGVGVKVLGDRGEAVNWQCRSWHTNSGTADTQIAAIAALQGTIVSVVDTWGVTTTSVLVEAARVISKRQVNRPDLGDRVQVDASVQLRKVAT